MPTKIKLIESPLRASIIVNWSLSNVRPGSKASLEISLGDWACKKELDLTNRAYLGQSYKGKTDIPIPASLWHRPKRVANGRLIIVDASGVEYDTMESHTSFCCIPICTVDHIENGCIHGWVLDRMHTSREIDITPEITSDSLAFYQIERVKRSDVEEEYASKLNTRHGFSIKLKTIANRLDINKANDRLTLTLFASNNNSRIELHRELLETRKDDYIVSFLRSQHLIGLTQEAEAPNKTLPKAISNKRPYIVIPVYKGAKETLECIESVLQSTTCDVKIVIINDCSPDPSLTDKLQRLSEQEKRIVLISNEKNLGYPGSVNIGFDHDFTKDIVILNSDTICPQSDWLDRLIESAYYDNDIGTVTPMTTNGTICAYPHPNADNHLPHGLNETQLDKLFADANAKSAPVTTPTGVGFCMFIKRSFLNDVGYFDAARWNTGYCEENDLCLRGLEKGWRSVVTGRVFIRHIGSVSFKNQKKALIERNSILLHSMYPYYSAAIAEFCAIDPIRSLRMKPNKSMLSMNPNHPEKMNVIHIKHSLKGGIMKFVDNWAHAVNDARRITLVEPLHSMLDEQFLFYEYSFANKAFYEIEVIDNKGLLQRMSAPRTDIYIHSLLGYSLNFIDILAAQSSKDSSKVFIVHDFSFVCPRINIIRPSKGYCGIQPDSVCRICMTEARLEQDFLDEQLRSTSSFMQRWRGSYYSLIRSCSRVISPSSATLALIKAYLPKDVDVVVVPNDNSDERLVTRRGCEQDLGELHTLIKQHNHIKIAVIGAIGYHKGFERLVRIAKIVEESESGISMIIIGSTVDDRSFHGLERTKITGAYDESEIASIIARENPTCALFLSEWPETYLFTLSHAFESRLPCISLDLGAQASRIKKTNFGIVVNSNSPDETFITACIKASALT